MEFLAQFILGLISVRSVNLKQISTAFQTSSKQDSVYRRIQRFFFGFSVCQKTIANLLMYNIRKNKLYTKNYYLYNSSLIEDLADYINFANNTIKHNFPEINIKDLKKTRIKNRIRFRKNPKFEFLLSGGLGYFSRQSGGFNVFSHGFTPYINIDSKFYNFALDFHVEFSPLFNGLNQIDDPILKDNYFLYNFYTSMDLGGWLIKQTIKLGLGIGFSTGDFYKIVRNENGPEEKSIMNVVLLFIYFNFSFLPTRSFQINLNMGAFFSPKDFTEITISFYFPLYLKISFRYFFYKQLFFEMSVPYYMIGINQKDGDGQQEPSFQAMVNIGFGWRFEWGKE